MVWLMSCRNLQPLLPLTVCMQLLAAVDAVHASNLLPVCLQSACTSSTASVCSGAPLLKE